MWSVQSSIAKKGGKNNPPLVPPVLPHHCFLTSSVFMSIRSGNVALLPAQFFMVMARNLCRSGPHSTARMRTTLNTPVSNIGPRAFIILPRASEEYDSPSRNLTGLEGRISLLFIL